MKLKMIVTFTALILLSGLLIGCQDNKQTLNENDLEDVLMIGDYPRFDDEESLFNHADLVIIGQTKQKFLERNHVIDYIDSSQQAIADYYTKTEIEIANVIKQPDPENFKPNDQLTIIEPISIITYDDGKRQKLIGADYQEIEHDYNYLIYLTENTYGDYTITNSFNGRFNLEDKEDYQYVLAVDYSDDTEETFEEELMRIHEKLFAEAKQRIKQN